MKEFTFRPVDLLVPVLVDFCCLLLQTLSTVSFIEIQKRVTQREEKLYTLLAEYTKRSLSISNEADCYNMYCQQRNEPSQQHMCV